MLQNENQLADKLLATHYVPKTVPDRNNVQTLAQIDLERFEHFET